MELNGCAAIVTGGSGGLGQRICRALALNGVNVVVNWYHILTTILTGTFNCIKAVAPLMKAQGQGRIVNISSGTGVVPRGSSIAYAVSKAGIIHLTKCMAVALAPAVTVNCVAPGFMEGTRMTSNRPPDYVATVTDFTLLRHAVSKVDVAEQLVLFCRSDSVTGQTLLMDLRPLLRGREIERA